MDKVRIYWTVARNLPGLKDAEVYNCRVEGNGFDMSIFSSWDRDEFFRRYDAVVVSKAPREGERG